MIKKEFEKESYLAPEWGTRTIRVERQFLGDGATNYGDDGEPGGDEGYNEQGEY